MSEPMKNIIRFVVFSRPDLREELFNIMVPKVSVIFSPRSFFDTGQARYSEEIMLDKFRALLARIDAAHARTCANLQTVALLRGLQIPSMPAAAAGYIQRYLSLPDPIPVWRGYLAHAMTWPLINEIAGFKTGEALKVSFARNN